MKKWGFFRSKSVFLGLEIEFFKLLSKKMRFLDQNQSEFSFFLKKTKKISKKKLPY